jgi:hypothetical protein
VATWIAPTVAVSLALIALCVVALAMVILVALRDTRARTAELGRELAGLRQEIAPAIEAVRTFSEAGAEMAETARVEVQALGETSAVLRREVNRGLRRARRRLDDFDALIEVLHEEVEDAALDLAVALRTVRASRGLLGQVRRFLTPGRKPRA